MKPGGIVEVRRKTDGKILEGRSFSLIDVSGSPVVDTIIDVARKGDFAIIGVRFYHPMKRRRKIRVFTKYCITAIGYELYSDDRTEPHRWYRVRWTSIGDLFRALEDEGEFRVVEVSKLKEVLMQLEFGGGDE